MIKSVGPEYVKDERKNYSLYVLESRAIPSMADGLKHAARRVIWVGKHGKQVKTATLAGATMPLHPHAMPDGAINTLAAPWGNNIPLFDGHGAFGTMLAPNSYGASRYTSVSLSKFAQDVILADIDLIPMVPNYDDTLEEPRHFLPLMPIALLNPQDGIAVGFASSILPRSLGDIITDQIAFLSTGKSPSMAAPTFEPLNAVGTSINTDDGTCRWRFFGEFKAVNSTTIKVTNLPYGLTHEKFIERLIKLEEENKIVTFIDDSKDEYNITVKVKRTEVDPQDEAQVTRLLGLTTTQTENMTMLDFDGKRVINTSYSDVIRDFSTWRLQWYKKRYERLLGLLEADLSKLRDIVIAIQQNVGGRSSGFTSREELKDFLRSINIVNLDYIADLPIYRFTKNELDKVEKKIIDAEKTEAEYKDLIADDSKRLKIYISELKTILKKFAKCKAV